MRRIAHRVQPRPRKTFAEHCAIWPSAQVTDAMTRVLQAGGSRDVGTLIAIDASERADMRIWTVVEGWMIGHCDRGWYWTDGPGFEYRRQFCWSFETALRNFAVAWAKRNIEAEIERLVKVWQQSEAST